MSEFLKEMENAVKALDEASCSLFRAQEAIKKEYPNSLGIGYMIGALNVYRQQLFYAEMFINKCVEEEREKM